MQHSYSSYLKIKSPLGQYLQKILVTAKEDEMVKVIKIARLLHSAMRLLMLVLLRRWKSAL